MTPELVLALGKPKCEKKKQNVREIALWLNHDSWVSACVREAQVWKDNEDFLLFSRTNQFIESIHWRGRENKPPWPWLNFLRRLPSRGEEHLADRFPATQPRTEAAAPGAQWNSSGKDHVHTPKLARRWVGRSYVLLSIKWPCRPSRLPPLLHNILTRLQQEPNSIYLAVNCKMTGAISPLAKGNDG